MEESIENANIWDTVPALGISRVAQHKLAVATDFRVQCIQLRRRRSDRICFTTAFDALRDEEGAARSLDTTSNGKVVDSGRVDKPV